MRWVVGIMWDIVVGLMSSSGRLLACTARTCKGCIGGRVPVVFLAWEASC